jgi:epidermal growth factor receptor substrate 15
LYAQVRAPITAELFRQPGPLVRIDGWNVPEGEDAIATKSDQEKDVTETAEIDEQRLLVEALMKEEDKDGFGILNQTDAAKILRRSGLPDEDLAIIWDLVDKEHRGFLGKGDLKRALRLVSCVQRGYSLHAGQYEKRTHPINSFFSHS